MKASTLVQGRALKGLRALAEEKQIKNFVVVSLDPNPRRIVEKSTTFDILPWTVFLERLWNRDFF